MTRIVFLDAGPLGLITNPKLSPQGLACARWFQQLVLAKAHLVIPEISDYEVRRELLRANKSKGVLQLDQRAADLEYLPLSTAAMRQAAVFWAQARAQGKPTASDSALDADVILAGQAATYSRTETIIATTNPRHLARFTPADLWDQIHA